MGEIKSTLDLVLEKTRNLSLSKEEKESLVQQEMEKKIQGLCNKFAENVVPLNRLKEEIEKLKEDRKSHVYSLLKRYLLSNINLDKEDLPELSALSEITGLDTSIIASIQGRYKLEKEEAKEICRKKAFDVLEKRGISGSAVAPNLDKTKDWNQLLKDLRKKYQEKLRTLTV